MSGVVRSRGAAAAATRWLRPRRILPQNLNRSFATTTSSQIQSPFFATTMKFESSSLSSSSRRSMVMVTQTKQHHEDDDDAPPSSNKNMEYQYNPVLQVTPACLARVEHLIAKQEDSNNNSYLRVYVDAGGCSGFSYKFELDSEPVDDEDDIVVCSVAMGDSGTVPRVVVDEASLELIQGSTIDYVQEMIKSAFVVADNPQSESACGCGSSFAVKNFAANPALD